MLQDIAKNTFIFRLYQSIVYFFKRLASLSQPPSRIKKEDWMDRMLIETRRPVFNFYPPN